MNSLQFCSNCIIQATLLILVANGAPIVARKISGQRFNCPIDFGYTLNDGRSLFGQSKTWLGLIAAVTSSIVVGTLFGLSFFTSALFGFLAMTGDLISSFCKRRLGYIESSRMRSLDVFPEALLPLWILRIELNLNWADIIVVLILFYLVEVFVSPVLYRLHIRKKPY